MSERDKFWERVDGELVEQEAENARLKAFLSEATEDAMTEWDIHIQDLPLDEAFAALEGLRDYAQEYLQGRNIDLGWHKDLQDGLD